MRGGVNITIPVQEGVSYRWARSIWVGLEQDKLTVDELGDGPRHESRRSLPMRPRIDNGLKSATKGLPSPADF